MSTKLIAVAALIIVLGCSSSYVADATKGECGTTASPAFSWSDLNNVLEALAKDTSTNFFPYRYYPYNSAGSVKGHAICYTDSQEICNACLEFAKASLIYCSDSQIGTYKDHDCFMNFWQIQASTV